MPRYARTYQKFNTKTYHIILRSINQQEIFYDDTDRRKFLKSLENTKENYQYDLYAYVLMNNHVHLLIMDKEDNLSKIVQSLATSYALYFNKKYDRIGHVFYNRFKSKCVDTLPYFINLVRYIHFNPEKAGICEYCNYNWSSYKDYLKNQKLVDANKVLKMVQMNQDTFKSFHEKYKSEKSFILEEFEMEKTHVDDETAIKMIKQLLNINNLISIQNLKAQKRDEIIAKIAKIKTIEKKQLARILGINIRMIYRAIRKNDNINSEIQKVLHIKDIN